MSFDTKNWGECNSPIRETWAISTTTQHTSLQLVSLLGMHRLNFDIHTDISNDSILKVLTSWYYFLNNFEENWYGCIQRKNPDMWTWLALVTGQYFKKRWCTQWIKLFKESQLVWRTHYIDENWSRVSTPIYLVWSISTNAAPMSWALNEHDIVIACNKLLVTKNIDQTDS